MFDPVSMSFSMIEKTLENSILCESLKKASFSLEDINIECWHSFLSRKTEGAIPFHKIIWDIESINDRKFVDRQCKYFLEWKTRNGKLLR